MNSHLRGTVTSHSEATSISAIGFWLLVDDAEYFSFCDYPVFQQATVARKHLLVIGLDNRAWPGLTYQPYLVLTKAIKRISCW